jgi:hypothetical protein
MEINKLLVMTYISKSADIPKYYLGGNIEFFGEAWNNQKI